MATMTAAEIAYVRAKSGDDCDPYVVGDVLLQTYFDTAGTLNATIVSVLEDRIAKSKAATINLATGGQGVSTANIEFLERQRDYWSAKAGVIGGGIGTGYIDLNIDANEDDDL